ncbi:MAG TPA: hypothetical protein PKE40_13910 [Arachnia sp.]|nr:hypothetical protein [Arachnia sp.]HMT87439.1 hypothetical protein [Arachnia sp.]
MSSEPISAEVLAVIVAMVDGEPCVLTLPHRLRLPSGPLLPGHRSLQTAVRAWVEQQTGLTVGYLEQLYTFADQDRDGSGTRTISVSYLGLVRGLNTKGGRWRTWYSLFPWEDQRDGATLLTDVIAPALKPWATRGGATRWERCAIDFGLDRRPWQPDLALQRYEVLWEAGLVPESPTERAGTESVPGERMDGDHRRVLATGIARLRTKIQYRPVVFELMPEEFTLSQLQSCVEALAGQAVHTQNFRRFVEQQQLVEETGGHAATRGRPARLYRFRQEVLQERSAAGTKLPAPRSR